MRGLRIGGRSGDGRMMDMSGFGKTLGGSDHARSDMECADAISTGGTPVSRGRRVVETFALVLAMIWAGGCVNQKAEVARYRQWLDGDSGQAIEPLREGESLTLGRALLLANQDNETLAIRGEDYIQALSDKDRAFAGFLPTITLAPNYTIADNSSATSVSSGQAVGTIGGFKPIGKTLRRFEAPVTGSMNLFRGFHDAASFESAIAAVEQRRQILLDAQASLLLQVAETYYQILRLEKSVEVIKQSLQAQMERVRDASAKLRAGTGKPLDVAQSEAQAASTRVRLVQAQGGVTSARTLLAYLIGTRGMVTGPLKDEYDIPADVGSIPALLERAWANRDDLKAAHAAVESAKHDVDAAIAEYYPSVSLNLTGFLYRENFDNASKWNSLLSVNLPIFSAGIIEADVRFAWSRLRQALMAESLLTRQVEQDVRTRYEDLHTSRASLEEIQSQVRAATEAYRQAKAGFDAGTAITLDVLSAQDVLLQAQLEWTTEEFNEKVQYLDLIRATGSLTLGAVQRATTRPTTRPIAPPAIPAPAGGTAPRTESTPSSDELSRVPNVAAWAE